jgi:hypothetical protein
LEQGQKFFIYFAVAYEKHRNIRPKARTTTQKKAEGLPLLGIGYDDIIGVVWLSSFYS